MRLKLKQVVTVRNIIGVLVTGALIGGLILLREPGGLGPKKLVSPTDTSGSSDVVNSVEVVAANEIMITASQRYCYENWPVEIQYYKLVMNNGFCDLGFQPIPFERDCLIVAHTSMEWIRDVEIEVDDGVGEYPIQNFPIVFKVSGPCSEVPKELLVPKNVQTTNLRIYGGLSTTSFVFPEGILEVVPTAILRGPDSDGSDPYADPYSDLYWPNTNGTWMVFPERDLNERMYTGPRHLPTQDEQDMLDREAEFYRLNPPSNRNLVFWDSFFDEDNFDTVNDKTFKVYGLVYTYLCSWDLTCDAEYEGE